MTHIRRARFPEDLDAVNAIFREYNGGASVSLDFQNYEDELANLPGKYAAPRGGCSLHGTPTGLSVAPASVK
jgi:putative acetyltransferase